MWEMMWDLEKEKWNENEREKEGNCIEDEGSRAVRLIDVIHREDGNSNKEERVLRGSRRGVYGYYFRSKRLF